MPALTLRLDQQTDQALRRLVASSGTTRSEVVRAAILERAQREGSPPEQSVLERIGHLLGVVAGLPADLSERTGERFTTIVAAKRRRRAR